MLIHVTFTRLRSIQMCNGMREITNLKEHLFGGGSGELLTYICTQHYKKTQFQLYFLMTNTTSSHSAFFREKRTSINFDSFRFIDIISRPYGARICLFITLPQPQFSVKISTSCTQERILTRMLTTSVSKIIYHHHPMGSVIQDNLTDKMKTG